MARTAVAAKRMKEQEEEKVVVIIIEHTIDKIVLHERRVDAVQRGRAQYVVCVIVAFAWLARVSWRNATPSNFKIRI